MTALSKLAGTMVLVATVWLSSAPTAAAAEGVLDRVAKTGEFRIGYATGSPPLSFSDADGKPAGYSIELCRHIGRTLQRELGLPKLEFIFVPLISMQDRLSAV